MAFFLLIIKTSSTLLELPMVHITIVQKSYLVFKDFFLKFSLKKINRRQLARTLCFPGFTVTAASFILTFPINSQMSSSLAVSSFLLRGSSLQRFLSTASRPSVLHRRNLVRAPCECAVCGVFSVWTYDFCLTFSKLLSVQMRVFAPPHSECMLFWSEFLLIVLFWILPHLLSSY